MCDPEMDFTLVIDYNVFTIVEMKSVLKVLYHSSSFCYEDIYLLAKNVIERMEHHGVRLREKENRGLAELVIDTFNTVKKIHPCPRESTTLRNIQTIYNHYMFSELTESPVASPVKSPGVNAPIIDPTEEVDKVSIPKKMKKAFRRNS